ncbi:hypothetical protein RJ641_005942 [Dillenia turbinata]|uniref:Thioredoxin-related transmembrane protein 2 n=1 Tax=Dillenia turbinata TaxID=194707 RepID=A0AAN8VC63_9MAGN
MNPLKWVNQIVSEPFYFLHLMTFLSYLIIRHSSASVLSPEFSARLLRREIQAILGFLVLTVVKVVKEETWEAFIADSFLLAKVFLVTVTLFLDYHLALWYIFGFVVQQPAYHGLGSSNRLTPLQLESLLTEGNTSRFWLVEFRALCSSSCIRASRFFPDLSITYSNKNLSFGIVDLGLFPNAAEKFGISLGGRMGQLPSYILFENAVEVTRFPEVDFESKGSHPPITKKKLSDKPD